MQLIDFLFFGYVAKINIIRLFMQNPAAPNAASVLAFSPLV